MRNHNRCARAWKKNVTGKLLPFNDDLKSRPYGRLDCVRYPLSFKHTMSNQFARSQSREQIADCRLGRRPSSVLEFDDILLVRYLTQTSTIPSDQCASSTRCWTITDSSGPGPT